jgi:hypothetical protein
MVVCWRSEHDAHMIVAAPTLRLYRAAAHVSCSASLEHEWLPPRAHHGRVSAPFNTLQRQRRE